MTAKCECAASLIQTNAHEKWCPTLDHPDYRPADRWVACSKVEFGDVGRERHLVAAGGLTTVCGASASHPDIWRANTRKPKCPVCMRSRP